MTDDADRAAKALIAALRLLADSLPGMHEKQVAPGVISLMSGLPMATLNGVFTDAARPDVTELDRAAAGVAGLPLPWSIQFRGEPEPAAERVAARYGLTARTTSPLMVYHPAADQQAPPARASAAASVVVADAGDRAEYAAALAAGFEAPPEIMAPFSSPEAFALPGAVPYLAREDGQVVAVGFGVFGGRDGRRLQHRHRARLPRARLRAGGHQPDRGRRRRPRGRPRLPSVQRGRLPALPVDGLPHRRDVDLPLD